MNDADLLKLKVEVLAKSDTNFMELATLVDKPDFLAILPKIRKEYGISEADVNIDGYDKYDELISNNYEKHVINFSKYKNPKKLLEYVEKHLIAFNKKEGMETYPAFDTEMLLICYIFKRPPIFADVCKSAVLRGVVGDYDYKTTKVIVTDSCYNLFYLVSDLELPQVAITVSPNSSDREILEAGRIAKTLYKTDKRLSYYKPRIDKATQIRKYREWYWMYLSGKRYVDIANANEWSDRPDIETEDSGIDDNRVCKAITYYKKLLAI